MILAHAGGGDEAAMVIFFVVGLVIAIGVAVLIQVSRRSPGGPDDDTSGRPPAA